MVFNWFRRQYNDKEKEKEQEQQKEITQKQPEITPPPEPEIAEDYLAWAKTAYKNIQAKQKSETATETTVPAEETAPETPALETVAKSVVTEETAPETPALETVAESVVTEETALETTAETNDPVGEVEASPEEETPVQVPFWAKDDRQARLERLINNAIEEAEPEVSPGATVTTPEKTIEEIPDFAFDEGFVWSAEILA
ncbi:MAG: signal recognition particle-docking protein FtsY, partial [Phormidium sp.]